MKHLYSFLVLLLVFLSVACGGGAQETPRPTAATSSVINPTKASSPATRAPATRRPITPARPAQINGFDTIALSELPSQALDTLDLIREGGPFPYRQDGAIFQNRERLLPLKPKGYYHEYTVETPGSDDRGARRIITGNDGELYYTDDHYDSFKVILQNE